MMILVSRPKKRAKLKNSFSILVKKIVKTK